MTSPTDPQIPSDKRIGEVAELWARAGGQVRAFAPSTASPKLFMDFIAALDAQSAERIRDLRGELDQTRHNLAITELNEQACLREIARLHADVKEADERTRAEIARLHEALEAAGSTLQILTGSCCARCGTHGCRALGLSENCEHRIARDALAKLRAAPSSPGAAPASALAPAPGPDR